MPMPLLPRAKPRADAECRAGSRLSKPERAYAQNSPPFRTGG
ncbi:hypothetical protein NMD1_01705 [Novosphingobium sp. MD-1]|nr:hypothetical protein NMD1_01705 [Novosphingobium sp. MD-1]